MPQAKAAMMVAPADIRIATTSGHIFEFKAGEKKFVPALAVGECAKYGVKEVARFKGTDINIPAMGMKGQISSQLQGARRDDGPVEEVSLDNIDSVADAGDAKPQQRNTKVFDEPHMLIRNGIQELIDEGNPDDWTNGKPKVPALQRRVLDMSVTAKLRDEVWDKMESAGEIPEDLADRVGF